MLKYLFLGFVFWVKGGSLPAQVAGGDTVLQLRICVTDSLGAPLPHSYITTSTWPQRLILWHQNIGDLACYSRVMPMPPGDSLQFTISHTGYAMQRLRIAIASLAADTSTLMVKLLPLGSTLPEAIVTAPPVWIRGDTTFFKVDAFKNGDERKLRDVITKLPGFEFDRTGRLLFQHRPVDRITIEGQEIFSDKLELMLNSFPAHVLDQIQAIENQSRNRLLKGLANDQLVFVNLGLKKEKLRAAFGDGEVGLGTGSRYAFNPVLFGLYNKLKMGWIANYNSLGTGFDWKYEAEMKLRPHQDAERWMLQGPGLHIINNVESRRYIRNQLWDNRLQVNLPLSKKLTQTIELNWVKDRQTQQTALDAAIFNDGVFVNRKDSNRLVNRPDLHNHSIKWDWRPDSSRQLIAGIDYYGNFLINNNRGTYLFEDNSRDSTAEQLRNRLHGMGLFFDYTTRSNANKAWFLRGSYHWEDFPQSGTGFSMAYPAIFGIQQGYNILQQQTNLPRQVGYAEYKTMTRPRRTLFNHGIEFYWEKAAPQNQMLFTDSAGQMPALPYAPLSQQGRFEMLQLAASSSTSLLWGKLPVSLRGKLGWQTNLQEQFHSDARRVQGVVIDADVTGRRTFGRGKAIGFTLRHQQSPVTLYQMPDYLLPVQMVQFRRFAATHIPQAVTNITGSYRLQHGRNHSVISAFITRNWNGHSLYNQLFQFAQIMVDSITRRPVHSISFNYNGGFYWTQHGLVWNLSAGYNNVGRLYAADKSFDKGRMDMYYLNSTLTKNWNKRIFVEWQSQYSLEHNVLPASFGTAIAPKVHNLRSHLRPRWLVNAWLSVAMQADYYLNNLGTANQASFFLWDTEAAFKPARKPFSFRLRFENITNQPYFFHVNQSALSQSFFTIPMVQRNIILFVRYEL